MQINRWKQFQLLWKTKNTKKQTIEHSKNSIQTNKETRKKCKEKIEKKKNRKKNTTINYTDPEARKNLNKKGKTQTEYNEQITVNNKNELIIAVDATEDANDQKQLLPIITQNNIQKALNITTKEADKKNNA